jgi:hypothetical protein
MAFNRRWDEDRREYIVDRDLTGPPKPAAETGTVVAADGSVVAQSDTINITPATPVNVNLPSPNEPIITADGKINHHWWRFFNELYLRTGGVVDNINRVPTAAVGSGTTDALVFTGNAPVVKTPVVVTMGAPDALTTTGNIPVPA